MPDNQNTQETTQSAWERAREAAQATREKTQGTTGTAGSKVQEAAEAVRGKVEADIQTTKEAVSGVTPTTPPALKAESSAQDLKARLDWGAPALTIIDVRDRDTHNQGHITGALPIPMNELVQWAQSSLEPIRDIYVYGETDKETAEAANSLRKAGFVNVAELKGGLNAWKEIAGATDGIAETKG